MQHQQAHHQQQQQQQHYPYLHHAVQPPPSDPYRAAHSNGDLALPPIQHFESSPAMQAHSQSQHHYGTQPPPLQQHPHQQQQPPYIPTQYPYSNGAIQPASLPSNVAPQTQNGVMRYPIPPQTPIDSRQMSGGRHKKEIKRRTKTGCLTCRKRRIKTLTTEQCDEAHPECRNCQKSKRECLGYDPIFKQQPGPAAIQPAPSIVAEPQTLPSVPAVNQHQSLHHVGGAPASAGPHDYNASLDPALSGNDPDSIASAQNSYTTTLKRERKVKNIAMEQLFSLNDIAPAFQVHELPPSLPSNLQQDIADFYSYNYAAGLDKMFETSWYSQRGLAQLEQDDQLLDFVAQCLDRFRTKSEDYHARKGILSLEARLIWQFACMPRNTPQRDAHTWEVLPRIDTVENLLTGQFLPPTRIPPPPRPGSFPQDKEDEQGFWHNLGRFVSLRDDQPDSTVLQHVNDTLGGMRGILGMIEARDVLYSLAIARHIGGRMTEFHPGRRLVASTNADHEDLSKLVVAQDFTAQEEQRGTTQVVQRICGMSIRSWALQKQ
ncbi:hypothetical protein MBLNU230_g4430t1 [Neophaeotheca triangularis]